MNVGAGHWDNFHWRVYTRAYNLAVGTTASQSSTLDGAGPWRAIDGNAGTNWWWIGGITGQAQTRNVFQTHQPGRFVRVQLRGTNYLSLAEVQVYIQ